MNAPKSLLLTASFSALSFNAVVAGAAEASRLENIVVTASRQETTLREAPASISVVTSEELQRIDADDLADALTAEAGLNVTSVGQTRRGISIRGMPVEHTLYLIDGRRISSSNSVIAHSDYELNWLPQSAIERVEVVRGPMSSLYGANALGGVVNVITRDPGDAYYGELSASVSQLDESSEGGTGKASFYQSGPIVADTLAFTLAGQFFNRDNLPMRENETVSEIEQRESRAAQGALEWTPAAGQKVRFTYSRNDDERERGVAARSGHYTSTDEIERQQYGLSYQGDWQWGHARANAYQADLQRENSRTNGAEASRPQEVQDRIIDGHVGLSLVPGHLVSVGGQLREEKLVDTLASTDGESTATHKSLFLQDEWQLSEPLKIVSGVGLDNHEEYGSEVNPRLYAVYNLNDAWTLKGGYGEGFRAPSLTELSGDYQVLAAGGRFWVEGNPDLEPERSSTYEMSAEYSGNVWAMAARAYENQLDDLVQTLCYVDCGIRGRERRNYQNISESQIRGFELEASRKLTDTLRLDVNHTFLDTEDLGSGEPLENRPQYIGNMVLAWTPFESMQLRWRAEFVGKQYVGADHYAPRYNLQHLDMTVELTPSLTLYSGIENLLDERLLEISDQYSLAEPGREIRLGLTAKF
ncbi:TonB-dependent receptor domain-containing protein [Microbulbifer halophilus]|uniref:TonB-dependent receptor domain-containing protein n=1 Tax=Microbulbifer halophilus TaxID=453963 RepID=A0ABW5EFM2_9GAMM|nr:TonB-dependent receptor [Microbulbifer halophilus]MCW8128031.1 TonB-dependent receptor [Microbulbifer halophilus]